MNTLAFLMNKGPMDGGPESFSYFDNLIVAVAFCGTVSAVWLLAVLLDRKKGKPLKLPSSFWYFAGPGSAGLFVLAAIFAFAFFNS